MSFNKWVAMWGGAVSVNENRPESYGKDITLIYPVTCPFDGDRIRITWDNYCGLEDITLTRVSVYLNKQFHEVRFAGQERGHIAAGKSIVSDDVEMNVKKGDVLEVRFYLGEITSLRSAVFMSGPLTGGSYAVGDYTMKAEVDNRKSRPTNMYYFLSNISIRTSEENHAIVCYGDSITAQSWPDYLLMRCMENEDNHTSVIRRATSGSRILREYDCITYESYGLMGKKRFQHEVPTDGADMVIIQQGINDIIHPVGEDVNPFRPMSDLPTAAELMEGITEYIKAARQMGLKVYLGTLLPIEGWRTYALFREDLKSDFNMMLRNCKEADGCIDFGVATARAERQAAFLEGYDSGDHLHPSEAGYRAMADAVPEDLLY